MADDIKTSVLNDARRALKAERVKRATRAGQAAARFVPHNPDEKPVGSVDETAQVMDTLSPGIEGADSEGKPKKSILRP